MPASLLMIAGLCLAVPFTQTASTATETSTMAEPGPVEPPPVEPPPLEGAPGPEALDLAPLSAPPPPLAPLTEWKASSGALETSSTAYDITVVGTRLAETGGSAQILNSKKLEQLNYDDPHAVLAAVPGVYARGEDGVGLRPNIGLRGVNPDRSKKVTLLEDGILFGPAPYSAPAAYYFPLITRMSQVRVIKGPGAVSYGPQTIAGAIDLVTRPALAVPQAAADLALGAYGYRKFHGYAGTGDENFGVVLEGVHLESTGFKKLLDGADTGFSRNEIMAKGRYLLDVPGELDHHLVLKLTYSDERSNETYLGLTEADFRADPQRRYDASQLDQMNWHRISGVLSDTIDLTERISLVVTAYRHDLDRTWRKVNGFRNDSIFDVVTNPGFDGNNLQVLRGTATTTTSNASLLVGPNHRVFVSQGVEARLNGAFETGPVSHRFEAGARFHYDSINRRHSQDGFLVNGAQLTPDGTPTEVTELNQASTWAGAFLLSDAVGLGDLTLTPGLRVEILRSNFTRWDPNTEAVVADFDASTVAVLPGISAYYGILEGLGVLAGVHRGFSPPVPSVPELGEPPSGPELSINWEAGTRYSHRRSRVEAIGFYNDYSNLTDTCSFSSGCLPGDLDRQVNAGQARIWGLEVSAEHEFKVGAVQIPASLAYTHTRAEFDNSFTSSDPIYDDVRAGDELPYVPRHQFNATLGLEHEWGGLVASLSYLSAMRESAGVLPLDQTLSTDELLTVDLGLELRPFSFLELYLSVRNVTDNQVIVAHRPFGARPNAPRWVQVGLRVASF